jgi:SMI1 / KNR4 family (SUKH-1)
VDAQSLLAGLTRRPPADPAAVRRLVETAGVELPREYLEFVASSDGGEGDVGERWLELWPISRVLDELETEPRYEGVVLFAGDGGNTVFGFDRFRDGDVVEGDWVGLNRHELIERGPFMEFLGGLASRQE